MNHCLVFALLALLMIIPLHAQDGESDIPLPHKAIWTFTIEGFKRERPIFAQIQWRADSDGFLIPYDVSDVAGVPPLEYEISTNRLTFPEHRRCALRLSRLQADTFDMRGNCVQWLSPDGRYMVYTTTLEVCPDGVCYFLTALGDLETKEHMLLESSNYSDYRIRWSENSQSFLIEFGLAPIISVSYLRIPSTLSDFASMTPIHVYRAAIDEITFVDISPDGWQVLFKGAKTDRSSPGLTLWDARWPASDHDDAAAYWDGIELFTGKWVDGAKFVPDHPDELLVVLDEGITRYNVKTQATTLVNPDVSSSWADWVYFSPDGQYALAYQHSPNKQAGYQISLFRVDPADN